MRHSKTWSIEHSALGGTLHAALPAAEHSELVGGFFSNHMTAVFVIGDQNDN